MTQKMVFFIFISITFFLVFSLDLYLGFLVALIFELEVKRAKNGVFHFFNNFFLLQSPLYEVNFYQLSIVIVISAL